MVEKTKNILCIEDDTFLLNLIVGKFSDAGISATAAHTGLEGVTIAGTEKPDLILLDLMLPDMSGLNVLDSLKADEATRNIPVIIFSNFGEKNEVASGLTHGAHTYLVKSNTLPGELVEVVTKVLEI